MTDNSAVRRKPKKSVDVITECAAEMGVSVAELNRRLGFKSNTLAYIGKLYRIGPALVGRAYIKTGNSALTKRLAAECEME